MIAVGTFSPEEGGVWMEGRADRANLTPTSREVFQ